MGIIKVTALVLAIVIAVAIIGSAGYIGVKAVGYMANQHFNFGDAVSWAANDWLDLTGLGKIVDEKFVKEFGAANEFIEVKACTSL